MKRSGGGPEMLTPDAKKPKVEDGQPGMGGKTTGMTPEQVKAMIENTKRQLELRRQQMGIANASNASTNPVASPVPATASLPTIPGPIGGFALNQSNALAAQLRAQLAAQQTKMGIMGSPGLMGASIASQRPPAALRLDDQGRLVDATGNVVQMTGRTQTLKANIREARAQEIKTAEEVRPPDLAENNPYYDPRLVNPQAGRAKRQMKFVEPGTYESLANRIRAHAQMEKLQAEIALAAKKTGISSATKLALLTTKTTHLGDIVPKVEWWDSILLPSGTYDELEELDLTLDNQKSVAAEDSNNSVETVEGGKKTLASVVKGITGLIEHPIPIEPPAEAPKNITVPVYLTKEEKKKIRRQKRREAEQEKQEKIRMGLMAPPDPKLKISNLMRVLGDSAVMEPSRAEAKVREQMAMRQETHNAANEARKLTDEQRGAKRDKKLTEDVSVQVQVAIFRVRDLSDASKRYKVDINAQQLKMTGCVLISPDATAIIVEGGPKAVKKYKALMLRRIKWSEDNVRQREGEAEEDEQENKCYLVWEGIVKDRTFADWKFEKFSQSQRVRDYLKKANVEHYW
eukprot:Ihof_evm3s388 gene=Ihof_evmTU3s388